MENTNDVHAFLKMENINDVQALSHLLGWREWCKIECFIQISQLL